jgi:hypothetical protein
VAATTIGNLALMLSASGGQLKADLDQSSRFVSDFAAGASGKLRSLASGGQWAGAFAAEAERGLVKAFSGGTLRGSLGGMAKNLVGAIPGVGGAVSGAIGIGEGVFANAEKYFERASDLRKGARRLGMDAGELSKVMALPISHAALAARKRATAGRDVHQVPSRQTASKRTPRQPLTA